MYRLIMVMGIAMATCLVVGCGSSEDEATSALLTKAQFIKRAGRICGTIQRERQEEVTAWEKNPPGGDSDGFKEVIAPSLKKEAEELQAVGAPKQFEPMIRAIAKAGAEIAQKGVKGLDSPSMKAYQTDAAEFHLLRC